MSEPTVRHPEIPQSLYALLAKLRSEAKAYRQAFYDEWNEGHASGLDSSARALAKYIEEHGGKDTTKEVS